MITKTNLSTMVASEWKSIMGSMIKNNKDTYAAEFGFGQDPVMKCSKDWLCATTHVLIVENTLK